MRAELNNNLSERLQGTAPQGEVRSISFGQYHTCGIRTDDTVSLLGLGHLQWSDTPPRGVRLRQCHGFPHMQGEDRRHRRLLGLGPLRSGNAALNERFGTYFHTMPLGTATKTKRR